jgi:hypothetical protein
MKYRYEKQRRNQGAVNTAPTPKGPNADNYRMGLKI